MNPSQLKRVANKLRKAGNTMNIVCLDLEGVLVPEIWIAFAEASGIPELKKTCLLYTSDAADE